VDGNGVVAILWPNLPDPGQRLRRDAGPFGDTAATSAREGDTGERRDAGAGMAASPSTCRIGAKQLMLTGGADRVNVRLPDRGYVATPGPDTTSARERDTGERRATVDSNGGSRDPCGKHLPDRGRAATSPTSRRRATGRQRP